MTPKRYDTRLVKTLLARGFDASYARPFERGAVLRCSQCEALSINGTPCHERGCPNERQEEADYDEYLDW